MMVDNNDWESAYRDAIDRGRARVDPPTPEELVAWSRGELPQSEGDHMRERLAYYPDLAAALAEDAEVTEDEPPLLTREQIATDWELIQQRLGSPGGGLRVPAELAAKPTRWSHWATLVPVVTTLLFAALFVRSRLTIDELRTQLYSPRENVERIELHATVPRGPASARPIVLQPSTKYLVLALNVTDDIRADQFRVAIRDLDAQPPTTVWESTITRGSDGAFSIEIPREFLARQAYQIDLFSNRGAEPIATYTIWISGSRRSRGTS
jgi:hypothetical protein